MTRGGRKDPNDGPERRCIVSGESGPRATLIRFVVGPDATIVPDLAGKLPGRGIWVTADRAALERAVSKRLFARAARQPVTVPEGLPDLIERLAARRLVELVSLANKAGLIRPDNAAYVGCLTAAEMGLSFGREHVIHAAVAAGGLSRRVVEEAAKLARLRGQDDGVAVAEERTDE